MGCGFELRHLEDATRAVEELKTQPIEDLRTVAQFTSTAAFRPLKSAPNLRGGWRAVAESGEELERALHHLYPGALADWYAVRRDPAPVINYRDFTNRQTGMYRITQMLPDGEVAHVITACCSKPFCLKQRLWAVAGIAPDEPAAKSLIPCLEPCAVFLELARKAMRILQEEQSSIELSESDRETLASVLERAIANPPTEMREADFAAALNPRRVALLLAKLKSSTPHAEI